MEKYVVTLSLVVNATGDEDAIGEFIENIVCGNYSSEMFKLTEAWRVD